MCIIAFHFLVEIVVLSADVKFCCSHFVLTIESFCVLAVWIEDGVHEGGQS